MCSYQSGSDVVAAPYTDSVRYYSIDEIVHYDDVIHTKYPDYWSAKQDEYLSKSFEGPGKRLVRTNMPINMFIKNKGGSDGAGLCVFTSIYHTGVYQGLPLKGFRKFMESRPGGGYPEKVDRMLKLYASESKSYLPMYYHLYGKGCMNTLKDALDVGYMVCITWGTDYHHYGGDTIAHMVNLVYLDNEYGAILDNNFPDEFLWVRRPTFDNYAAWTGRIRDDGLWAIVFTDNPMPFVKRN